MLGPEAGLATGFLADRPSPVLCTISSLRVCLEFWPHFFPNHLGQNPDRLLYKTSVTAGFILIRLLLQFLWAERQQFHFSPASRRIEESSSMQHSGFTVEDEGLQDSNMNTI